MSLNPTSIVDGLFWRLRWGGSAPCQGCAPWSVPAARNASYAPAAWQGITGVMAPVVGFDHPARQHRALGNDVLAGHGQTQAVQPAEAIEVRAGERNVRQVEVFQLDGVDNLHPVKTYPQPRYDAPTSTPSIAKSRLSSMRCQSRC